MSQRDSDPRTEAVLDEAARAQDLVEVYETDSEMLASVVITEVLGEEGIPAVRHDRKSHAIPAPASLPGEIGIAVPSAHASRARTLLREAHEDGLLSEGGEEGRILDEDDEGGEVLA